MLGHLAWTILNGKLKYLSLRWATTCNHFCLDIMVTLHCKDHCIDTQIQHIKNSLSSCLHLFFEYKILFRKIFFSYLSTHYFCCIKSETNIYFFLTQTSSAHSVSQGNIVLLICVMFCTVLCQIRPTINSLQIMYINIWLYRALKATYHYTYSTCLQNI